MHRKVRFPAVISNKSTIKQTRLLKHVSFSFLEVNKMRCKYKDTNMLRKLTNKLALGELPWITFERRYIR